jgi:hypothetical protein
MAAAFPRGPGRRLMLADGPRQGISPEISWPSPILAGDSVVLSERYRSL